jgi:CubicO group peptidase (beta-lactamase class C family)
MRLDPVPAAMRRFRDTVDRRDLRLEGLHLRRAGLQPLAHRWTRDERRDVFSVSKTFTAVAVGMARAEGLLDLDDAVLTHLPDLSDTAAPGTEAMTVRHLLSMTAGNELRWDHPDLSWPGDPARAFLAEPLTAVPGTRYAYRGMVSYVLGRIVHAVSGSDLRDYLVPRLFDPLGIANPQWHRCPLGYSLGAVGLHLRTEEMSRLGQVLLDGGAHRGAQLVPADFVALMQSWTTPTGRDDPDNAAYGLHCWPCSRDHAWRMDGIRGQFVIMLPRQRAVVAVTADYDGPTTDILDAIWQDLVPALG